MPSTSSVAPEEAPTSVWTALVAADAVRALDLVDGADDGSARASALTSPVPFPVMLVAATRRSRSSSSSSSRTRSSMASRASAGLGVPLDDGGGVDVVVEELLGFREEVPARTAAVVVPSPTSSSWVWATSTSIWAAGCSMSISSRMVTPSFVMTTSPESRRASCPSRGARCGPDRLRDGPPGRDVRGLGVAPAGSLRVLASG